MDLTQEVQWSKSRKRPSSSELELLEPPTYSSKVSKGASGPIATSTPTQGCLRASKMTKFIRLRLWGMHPDGGQYLLSEKVYTELRELFCEEVDKIGAETAGFLSEGQEGVLIKAVDRDSVEALKKWVSTLKGPDSDTFLLEALSNTFVVFLLVPEHLKEEEHVLIKSFQQRNQVYGALNHFDTTITHNPQTQSKRRQLHLRADEQALATIVRLKETAYKKHSPNSFLAAKPYKLRDTRCQVHFGYSKAKRFLGQQIILEIEDKDKEDEDADAISDFDM